MFSEQSGAETADRVVLLHAANFSSRMWRPVAEQLSDFHLCLPDLPGHGRSIDQEFESIERTADDLAALIRRQRPIRPVHIVGLSLGAYVGLTLLIRHPDLASKAVLSGFHVGDMPQPATMILMGDLLSVIASTAWFQRKSAASLGVPTDLLDHEDFSRPQTNGRTIRKVNRSAVRFDVQADLDKISAPTLAVAGGSEHPTILRSLDIMQQRVALCEARTATGLGHAWPAQRPELFADMVRAWIAGDALPSELQRLNTASAIEQDRVPPAHRR